MVTGLTVVLWALLMGRSRSLAPRLLPAIGFGFLALMQVLPALLWLTFHGHGISDGSPSSAFVAHWAYALPHVLVLILCAGAAYDLARGGTRAISLDEASLGT